MRVCNINVSEDDAERFRIVLGLLEEHGAVTFKELRSSLGEDPHPVIQNFNKFYADKDLCLEINRNTYPFTYYLAGSERPDSRYTQARRWLGPDRERIDEILAWDDYRRRYAAEMWSALREDSNAVSLLQRFFNDGWTMAEIIQAMEDANNVAVQGVETLAKDQPELAEFVAAMRRGERHPPSPKSAHLGGGES